MEEELYCTACHGRGLDRHDNICPHCHGSGQEPIDCDYMDEQLALLAEDLELVPVW